MSMYSAVFSPTQKYMPLAAVIAVAGLLLRPRGVSLRLWLTLVWGGGAALFLLCMLLAGDTSVYRLLRAACIFVFGGLLMYVGGSARRVSWVNYGTMLIVLSGVIVFFNFAGSLSASGFALVLMGLLLAVGAYLLHDRRQKLIVRIKNSAPSPRHE